MRLALLFFFFVGCGHPHYTLTAPPPTASPFERLEAFNRLRASGIGEITTCSSRGGCRTSDYLVLADGREIWHADDLSPVVARDSEAARDHHEYRRLESRVWPWVAGMFVGLAAGVAMIHYGWSDDQGEPTNLMWAGVGVVAASGSIGAGGAFVTGILARNAKLQMFEHYNDGLAAKLNICSNGIGVVPCDAPNTPVAPDPMLRSLPQR